METIKLSNGIQMPILGYGVYRVSPEETEQCALLTLTTRDRLLYGTDYPYVAPKVIKANIERIKQHIPNK